MRRRIAPRTAAFASAALAVTLLLAGCGASGGSDASSEAGGSSGALPSEVDSGGGSSSGDVASGASAEGAEALGNELATGDRDVIVTGYLDLTVEDPTESAATVAEIVGKAGGRIDARSEQPGTDYQDASASITARVPSNRLDATLADLEAIGTVSSLSLESADVTQQTTDLEARISSLSAAADRLRQLLASAESTKDLINVESALSEREAELESLTAQRDYLADQVSLSTITITLSTDAPVLASGPDSFWDGLLAGMQSLFGFFAGALVVLGVLLPWLVLLALLAAIALLIVRSRRRRRVRST